MRINSKILSTIFHTNKEEINKYCFHLLKKKIIYSYIKGL